MIEARLLEFRGCVSEGIEESPIQSFDWMWGSGLRDQFEVV